MVGGSGNRGWRVWAGDAMNETLYASVYGLSHWRSVYKATTPML